MVPVGLDRLDERLEAGVANVVVADAELLERARRRDQRGERLAARLAELAVAEIERGDVLEALRAIGEHRLTEHGDNVERRRLGAVEQLDVLVVREAGEKRDGVGGVASHQRARLRRTGARCEAQRPPPPAAGAGRGSRLGNGSSRRQASAWDERPEWASEQAPESAPESRRRPRPRRRARRAWRRQTPS
jgi:hypothetical protein